MAGETAMSFRIRAESWNEYCEKRAEEECGLCIDPESGIAVQPVHGFIDSMAAPEEEAFLGSFDPARITKAAKQAATNSGIRALVLHICSPGGAIAGVQEACNSLVRLSVDRPDLPVMAYIDGLGCSAAAWIASACQETHASAGAMVGCISTILTVYDDSRMFENAGVKANVFTDGKFKSIGHHGVPLTDEQAAMLEANVKAAGAPIKAFIASRRPGLTDDDMQGQVFTASPGQYPDALLDSVGWESFDSFLQAVSMTLTAPE